MLLLKIGLFYLFIMSLSTAHDLGWYDHFIGKGPFISVFISPNTPMFLQGKISWRRGSSSLMLHSVVFTCQTLLKAFFWVKSLLQTISNSLVQVLFYASTFKLNLPRTRLLSTLITVCSSDSSSWAALEKLLFSLVSHSVSQRPTSQPLTNSVRLCTSLKNRWFLF